MSRGKTLDSRLRGNDDCATRPAYLEARHWIPAFAGMTIAQLARHVSRQDTDSRRRGNDDCATRPAYIDARHWIPAVAEMTIARGQCAAETTWSAARLVGRFDRRDRA